MRARVTKMFGGVRCESFEFVTHTDAVLAESPEPVERRFVFLS